MMAGAMTGGALVERWASLPFLIAGTMTLGAVVIAVWFFRLEGWKVERLEG